MIANMNTWRRGVPVRGQNHAWVELSFDEMGVWQGVAMDSLKYLSVPPCPTLLQSTPCGRAIHETALWPYGHYRALWPFHGLMAVCKVGGLRPSSTLLDTPRLTPMSQDALWVVISPPSQEAGRERLPTGYPD
jgi:hypothetical protein